MNYEEKYKEAIKKFENFFTNNDDRILYKHDIESIFPELKDSEDEKIRKELIKAIDFAMPIDTAEIYINWLKKQSKQKLIWSEVDDNLLNLSIKNLTELKNNFGDGYGRVGDCIYWLKSIKERIK